MDTVQTYRLLEIHFNYKFVRKYVNKIKTIYGCNIMKLLYVFESAAKKKNLLFLFTFLHVIFILHQNILKTVHEAIVYSF